MLVEPSEEIKSSSHVKDYQHTYDEAVADPQGFWAKVAGELSWQAPWTKVLEEKPPYARWFTGAKCNIVHNALDRHLDTPTADKTALIWVGQDMSERRFTYRQLHEEVCRAANALKSLGVGPGDRVSIYLPRIPEQFIAMLAVAKIGAIHSVVFSGFSAAALSTRVKDAQAKVIICADGYPYGKKVIESKKNADEAVRDLPQVTHVVVVRRANVPITMQPGRDIYWDELVSKQSAECKTEVMDAADPFFILYTSGTTGTPKGILHGHGGYMVGIYQTLKWVFNLQSDDIYFCTADAGWITGHSYVLYAPLMNGITTFVYEGTPDFPDVGVWWALVHKYKITKFYTAPTAVRALMKFGDEWPKKYDLSSIKILGSVGEPINPEAWLWYHKVIGGGRVPIMDTWWQTETGMFVLTPLPSVPLKPGSCFKPFPGLEVDIVDEHGAPVPANKEGYLVIKRPWPSMLLDVYNNPKKYKETYFENESVTRTTSDFLYFSGDSAKRDEDGYYWIIGRNDDVIKVSGHRLGSAELESAFVAHPAVAEAAVIGKPHEVKGESIKAFVILRVGHQPSDELKKELVMKVREMIGPIATPDEIDFVEKLPKTRSGKIMRRVLKARELGQPEGDTSTLEN
jgi:acetyl-CoA synthetase